MRLFFLITAVMRQTERYKHCRKHKENISLNTADKQLKNIKWLQNRRHCNLRQISNHSNQYFARQHVAEQAERQTKQARKLRYKLQNTNKRHNRVAQRINEVTLQITNKTQLARSIHLRHHDSYRRQRKRHIQICILTAEQRRMADSYRPNNRQQTEPVLSGYEEKHRHHQRRHSASPLLVRNHLPNRLIQSFYTPKS